MFEVLTLALTVVFWAIALVTMTDRNLPLCQKVALSLFSGLMGLVWVGLFILVRGLEG